MRFNKKKKPTKLESQHMAEVAALPCCKCDARPVQVHHITECGRRLGNYFTLPLCPKCHANINDFILQLELCRGVYEKLEKPFPELTTKIIGRK